MVINELREVLPEGSMVFDNPSFDKSIIGVSNTDQVIYDYERMVKELMHDEHWDEEDANDWVNYNTIRALQYMPQECKPIIVFPIDFIYE